MPSRVLEQKKATFSTGGMQGRLGQRWRRMEGKDFFLPARAERGGALNPPPAEVAIQAREFFLSFNTILFKGAQSKNTKEDAVPISVQSKSSRRERAGSSSPSLALPQRNRGIGHFEQPLQVLASKFPMIESQSICLPPLSPPTVLGSASLPDKMLLSLMSKRWKNVCCWPGRPIPPLRTPPGRDTKCTDSNLEKPRAPLASSPPLRCWGRGRVCQAYSIAFSTSPGDRNKKNIKIKQATSSKQQTTNKKPRQSSRAGACG